MNNPVVECHFNILKRKNMELFMYIWQYFLNWLNLLDHAGNTLLLGDSDETISARTARARLAGQKWAFVACAILTFLTKVVTFGKVSRDHCDYALDKSALPNSKEIWSWSSGKILHTPINEVNPQEINTSNKNN